MKNIMTKAWEIAKKGQENFGGKVKEYFATALKMAWTLAKKVDNTVELELREGSRQHKTWVAEIVGLCEVYGFTRKFVDLIKKGDLRANFVELQEGMVYEVCDGGDRYYVKNIDGVLDYLNRSEVKGELV